MLRDHDQDALGFRQVERLEQGDGLFRLDLAELEGFQADDVAFAHLFREDAAHRAAPHLHREGFAIVAGVRPEHDAAAAPLGRADRTLPRAAGPFLPPGLAAAAAHIGALLGVVRCPAVDWPLRRRLPDARAPR